MLYIIESKDYESNWFGDAELVVSEELRFAVPMKGVYPFVPNRPPSSIRWIKNGTLGNSYWMKTWELTQVEEKALIRFMLNLDRSISGYMFHRARKGEAERRFVECGKTVSILTIEREIGIETARNWFRQWGEMHGETLKIQVTDDGDARSHALFRIVEC
jgi:hypothetical protein